MDLELFAIPAVIFVTLTSLFLLINNDWRLSIMALAGQYVGVVILVSLNWPLGMAMTKLVTGWIAGIVLSMAMISLPPAPLESRSTNPEQESGLTQPRFEPFSPRLVSARVFQFLAATLVGLAVFSTAPDMATWVPNIQLSQAWGGLVLIGMGLLQLGFHAQPFRTVLGLLTVLSGFEILYAVIETSVLVAGLLAAVNLGVALVGAYLLVAPIMEETE